ncbi:uncharacterized protein LOC143068953 isoform X1 [Mytilus galloprovincialis]|uniref:uncharacterized protein LOC143068953 isoform X1 n=1 Tax=Mytilus galloprovincialis TaxID=29158 RepID=UPI003F7C5BA5
MEAAILILFQVRNSHHKGQNKAYEKNIHTGSKLEVYQTKFLQVFVSDCAWMNIHQDPKWLTALKTVIVRNLGNAFSTVHTTVNEHEVTPVDLEVKYETNLSSLPHILAIKN